MTLTYWINSHCILLVYPLPCTVSAYIPYFDYVSLAARST
nr:MAG TPA: hypothetical protein [Caudoviricetes sp.]